LKVRDDTPPRQKAPETVTNALLHQQTFDRAQVAWLMAQAYRWGYEARIDQENRNWPPATVFNLGRWYEQPFERQKADAAAPLSRPGDHKGGPVEWVDEAQQVAA
jgi:hypothetical protein